MQSVRDSLTIRRWLVENGALPGERQYWSSLSKEVSIRQIHATAINVVSKEDNELVVLAGLEIENCREKRLCIDAVRLDMPWGERVRFVPKPTRESKGGPSYRVGGLFYPPNEILNDTIAPGRVLPGHKTIVDGLLLGTVAECPARVEQPRIAARFTLIFTDGEKAEADLILANMNIAPIIDEKITFLYRGSVAGLASDRSVLRVSAVQHKLSGYDKTTPQRVSDM